VHIQVDYVATESDFAAAVEINAAGRPTVRWAMVGFWAALAVAGAATATWWVTVPAVLLGLVQVWSIRVGTGKMARLTARRFAGPTSVRITDESLSFAAGGVGYEIPWAAVARVVDNPLAWAVASKDATGANGAGATLLKAPFSPQQRAEFDGFLAALPGVTRVVRGAAAAA